MLIVSWEQQLVTYDVDILLNLECQGSQQLGQAQSSA